MSFIFLTYKISIVMLILYGYLNNLELAIKRLKKIH